MKHVLLAFLLTLVAVSCQKYEQRKFIHPIVLVPGDGGSQIEAKLNKPRTVHKMCRSQSDWFTLWLDPRQLLPLFIDCWADNVALKYDFKTKRTYNNDGVETRSPGFGNTSSVEYLSSDANPYRLAYYFHFIVRALVELGYERGKNIHGAPYDFRKAANEHKEYFHKVTELIEATYAENGNKSVILISHSMGSTMVLFMLNSKPEAWKDKYINCHISLSGVWAGTVKAMKAFAVGDNLGSPMVPSSSMMAVQRSNPSLNWLMPNLNLWADNEVLLKAANVSITKANFAEFYLMLNASAGLEMWRNTQPLVKDLKPPGVEVHCIYSHGISTIEQLNFYKFPGGEMFKKEGDGDGTVNLRSLEACKSWKGKQNQEVTPKAFRGVDHMHMLSDLRVINYVRDVVSSILNGKKVIDGSQCDTEDDCLNAKSSPFFFFK